MVASLVGLDMRATMDIDTSITALDLSEEGITKIIRDIISVSVDDNVAFDIVETGTIMDDFDYPGVRIKMLALFGTSRQPIKKACRG